MVTMGTAEVVVERMQVNIDWLLQDKYEAE